MTDVYCVEAFQALTQHNILSAAEEKELLKSMPLKVIALFGCEYPRFLSAFDNLTFWHSIFKEQLEAPSKVDDDFIDEDGSELLRDLLPFLYKVGTFDSYFVSLYHYFIHK